MKRAELYKEITDGIMTLNKFDTIYGKDFRVNYCYSPRYPNVRISVYDRDEKTWRLSKISDKDYLSLLEVKEMLLNWLEEYKDEICDFYYSEKLRALLNE